MDEKLVANWTWSCDVAREVFVFVFVFVSEEAFDSCRSIT